MNLALLREKKKLSQSEVARCLGITQQRYSRYERGEREADYATLCRLADFFDVSIDELVGRSNAPALFDDARVDRPEILEIYEGLTPQLQDRALAYMHGLAEKAAVQNSANVNVVFTDARHKKQ